MQSNTVQFPFVKNITPILLADDIIGMRPDETIHHAHQRYLMEQRRKKIEKIRKRM